MDSNFSHQPARCHGPYQHGRRWRVVRVEHDGSRHTLSFASEGTARDYIKDQLPTPGGSIAQAVTSYLDHLGIEPRPRGEVRRASTVELARHRLVAFLQITKPASNRPVASLTAETAESLFKEREAEVKPDTLVGELALVQRWARWCVSNGWLAVDPFAHLVVMGPRSAGKPQLRVDGARRFLACALDEGTEAGTAAAVALLMGLRASEVMNLQARDVDDNGRVLWVSRSKTRNGVRRLEVPTVLQSRLRALAGGKPGGARIWSDPDADRQWLYYHVVRLADAAGVDRVTPHGLRGTFATLAVEALPTAQVAGVLGHGGAAVTREHYLAPGAEQSAAAHRLEEALAPPA